MMIIIENDGKIVKYYLLNSIKRLLDIYIYTL